MVINKVVIGIIASAVILSIVAFFLFDNGSPSDEPSPVEKLFGLNDKSSDNGGSNNSGTSSSSSSSSGGGGGGGGGDAGGSTSTSSSSSSGGISCSTGKVSYALKNFTESFECQTNVSGTCTSMKASCSMEIYHLDKNAGPGEFILRSDLIERVNRNVLDTASFQETIAFGEFRTFSPNFLINDPNGVEEDLSCDLKIESIPEKEICT